MDESFKDLETRVRALEASRSELVGATGTWKTIAEWCAIPAAVAAGVLWRDVSNLEKRFDASDKANAKVESRVEALTKQAEIMRRHVDVIIDRQRKDGALPQIGAIVYQGIVTSVGPNHLSILPPAPELPLRFLLPADVPVLINGRQSTLAQIKLGMSAEVLLNDADTSIQAKE